MSETANGINGADTLAMVREECSKHSHSCLGCAYRDAETARCAIKDAPEYWEFEGEEDDYDD